MVGAGCRHWRRGARGARRVTGRTKRAQPFGWISDVSASQAFAQHQQFYLAPHKTGLLKDLILNIYINKSNYAKSSEKCRSGSSAGVPQRRHFWGAFLWFIHPVELISSVAASDKQTRGSKLIKNGEVNSAPSEEIKFFPISSLQSLTVSPTYNLYNHPYHHISYVF